MATAIPTTASAIDGAADRPSLVEHLGPGSGEAEINGQVTTKELEPAAIQEFAALATVVVPPLH